MTVERERNEGRIVPAEAATTASGSGCDAGPSARHSDSDPLDREFERCKAVLFRGVGRRENQTGRRAVSLAEFCRHQPRSSAAKMVQRVLADLPEHLRARAEAREILTPQNPPVAEPAHSTTTVEPPRDPQPPSTTVAATVVDTARTQDDPHAARHASGDALEKKQPPDSPDRDRRAAAFTAWRRAFGGSAVGVSEILARADTDADLGTALLQAADSGSGKLNKSVIGRWLRRNNGACVESLVLRKRNKHRGAWLWAILDETESRPPPGPAAAPGDDSERDQADAECGSTVELSAAASSAAPWADPADEVSITSLEAAAWKVVDIETTGLTPASKSVPVTRKMQQAGADPRLRARILTAAWPEPESPSRLRVEAWDLDTATPEQQTALASAALSGTVCGHNLAFDLSWLLRLAPSARPAAVLDTLLIARLAAPTAAVDLLLEAANDKTARGIAGRSGGWSLEALAHLFQVGAMDKTYQKPRSWVAAPPLSRKHYDYAIGDVDAVLKLLRRVLGSVDDADPLDAYRSWLDRQNPRIQAHARVYERLPLHLARMTLRGIPVSRENLEAYIRKTLDEAAAAAGRVAEVAPELAGITARLADPAKGVDDTSRSALAAAFQARGVEVSRSAKKGAAQVGEKDLRGAGADRGEAAPLFQALADANRATKRAAMAIALRDTVLRGGGFDADGFGRLHALFSPTTATARLSSQEPNGQNFPREAKFRAIFAARPGYRIVSCDYSALDVRVGAALAIREQRRIALALASEIRCREWYGGSARLYEAVHAAPDADDKTLLVAEQRLEEARELGDKHGEWSGYRDAMAEFRLAHFALALRRVLTLYGDGDFDAAWREFRALSQESANSWPGESAFRRAFRTGMDVHTRTGLELAGIDPDEQVRGLHGDRLKERLAKLKEDLGPKRQHGKVANLSLLYGMSPYSFRAHAAKVYGVHLNAQEAEETVRLWRAAYPEIDLLGASTALRGCDRWGDNPYSRTSKYRGNRDGLMWIYDPKQARVRANPIWLDTTLSDRPIAAVGLNAAVNYPDQGSGADLLHHVFSTLEAEAPDLYDRVIDQVHDELVFEVPEDRAEEAARRIREILEREGGRMLAPYGVPMAAEVAVGEVWEH